MKLTECIIEVCPSIFLKSVLYWHIFNINQLKPLLVFWLNGVCKICFILHVHNIEITFFLEKLEVDIYVAVLKFVTSNQLWETFLFFPCWIFNKYLEVLKRMKTFWTIILQKYLTNLSRPILSISNGNMQFWGII